MKRAIGVILVSILLGVTATLAIAWGAVLAADPTDLRHMKATGTSRPDDAVIQWWREHSDMTVATDPLLLAERRNDLLTFTLVGGADPSVYAVDVTSGGTISLRHPPGQSPPWVRVLRVESGWPRRCFSGERWERGVEKPELWPFHLLDVPAPIVDPDDVRLIGAFELAVTAGGAPQDALLPVRPIWGGLLLNASVLSLPALGLLTALLGLRWALRRATGRCPGCGYLLRGETAGCPECGWKRNP